MKMYSMMGNDAGAFPTEMKLTLNSRCETLKALPEMDADKAALVAKQIYNLCLLTQSRMNSDTLKEFLSDSFNILGMLGK